MATRTKTTTTSTERGGSRKVHDQPHRFLGLFLAPFTGLPVAWLIYVWTHGVDLHWGPLDWTVKTSPAAPLLANTFFVLATVGLSTLAWDFAKHRERGKQAALAGSVSALGLLFAINAGVGVSWLWSGLFILAGWLVAVTWSIARLDVTRNDKSDEAEKDGPDWLKKLKGWKARSIKPIHGDDGELIATEVEFDHADGDTVETLQDAKANIESSTGSPGGMSTATGGDRADRSKLRLMHTDPLIKKQMLPEPSSPGGSVADGAVIAVSAMGTKVTIYVGGPGGPKTPTDITAPSNYLFMGMSRAGKTVGENTMLTEFGTRRDDVILYLNKSKGMQDLRPVCPVTEVAVIEADGDTGGEYRAAFTQVEKIMKYRQAQLGRFGISAYSVKDCFHEPKWRTNEAGRREQMEPMPELIVHVGEADSILQSDGFRCQTIASKCLSLGIVIGFSMQRADHTQMPTGLRFNLGTSLCFGTSDDQSAIFALSEPTIKAGARPDYWKARKPGYFYVEGLGIDEEMFPVPNRTFGDEDKDVLVEKMLKRNLEWAPRMAKLDQGSVMATRQDDGTIWWHNAVAETERIRAVLLQQGTPQTDPANTPQTENEGDEYAEELRTAGRRAAAVPDDDDGFDFADEDPAEVAEDMKQNLREAKNVDGIDLYPPDPVTGERGNMSQATEPLKTGAADVSWGDDKPAPRDRAAALVALNKSFDELLADEALRDPADPTGRTVVITVSLVVDRYPYRSRPWFIESFQQAALGEIELDGGKTLMPAPDLGRTKGKYRLKRDH
jgi:hypothetical protein